jgi:glycosyltransferase involved in cell wall biosynthesis
MVEIDRSLCIAIPVFNDSTGLERTLLSLIGLDELKKGSLSVIVQDNFSTDRSYEVAKEISMNSDSRILVERNDRNLGFHGNLLALVRRCKSNYIWFLGAGEVIVVPSLVPLLEFLSETHRVEFQMGVVGAALSKTGLEPAHDLESWKFNTLRPAEDQCFRESISLNIVRTQLALEVLESALEKGDIERDSWPHLEMALSATTSQTFAVTHPPLVQISENEKGWWYHSPIAMDIYLRQIELLNDFIQSAPKTSWAGRLYSNKVSWGFAAMAFEMRINGRGFQKEQVEKARDLGLSGPALLATRLIK